MPTIENQSSLHGKTVVVTRPLQQCENMSQQLVKLGAKPILFPCIEILSVNCDDALAALPVSLDEIDMFIFISSNAVRYGFAQIPLLHKQMQTDKKFAAIGQATATELKNIGVQQILAPDQDFDSESLLSLPAMNNVQKETSFWESSNAIFGAGGTPARSPTPKSERSRRQLRSRSRRPGVWETTRCRKRAATQTSIARFGNDLNRPRALLFRAPLKSPLELGFA